MKPRPIDEAKNIDLRGSFPALQRAAQRARNVAARTGTALVISHNGVLEYRQPGNAGPLPPVPSAEADFAEHFQRNDVEWGLKGDD